ncbi:MAG: hypothetical protein HY074_09250 [Deltaproteobacteria bacterium]|nr:hypothetical protein [Deltaproteobacteria bacterium]
MDTNVATFKGNILGNFIKVRTANGNGTQVIPHWSSPSGAWLDSMELDIQATKVQGGIFGSSALPGANSLLFSTSIYSSRTANQISFKMIRNTAGNILQCYGIQDQAKQACWNLGGQYNVAKFPQCQLDSLWLNVSSGNTSPPSSLAGQRLVLKRAAAWSVPTSSDYVIGVDSTSVWFNAGNATGNGFSWGNSAGTVPLMSLNGSAAGSPAPFTYTGLSINVDENHGFGGISQNVGFQGTGYVDFYNTGDVYFEPRGAKNVYFWYGVNAIHLTGTDVWSGVTETHSGSVESHFGTGATEGHTGVVETHTGGGTESHYDYELHSGYELHYGYEYHSGFEYHWGTESHFGAEYHSGAETHSGTELHKNYELHSGYEYHSGYEIHYGYEYHSGFEYHWGTETHFGPMFANTTGGNVAHSCYYNWSGFPACGANAGCSVTAWCNGGSKATGCGFYSNQWSSYPSNASTYGSNCDLDFYSNWTGFNFESEVMCCYE